MPKSRSKNGYALISTILIGFCSILFLMALSTVVTSAVRSISANQFSDSLRNAAEIGIEYAISQYNTYPNPSLNSIDPSNKPSPITVPTSYLQNGATNSGIPNVTVTLNITYIPATPASTWSFLQSNSPIYQATLDPSTNATNQTQSFNSPLTPLYTPANVNGYRVIESTASNGYLSKTIRTIIMARFYGPLTDSGTPPFSKTGTGLFSVPLFSNGPLILAPSTGLLNVNGINSTDPAAPTTYSVTNPKLGTYNSYNLNLTTNTSASIGTGATVAGDVTVLSANSGNNAVASIPGGTVDGRLSTNGTQANTVQAPAGTNPSGNVLANADIPPNGTGSRLGLNESNPAMVSVASQYTVTPVPDVEGTPLPTLSQLSSSTSATPIASGAYSSGGLDTTGVGASIPVQNSTAPVQVYVSDTATTQANGQAINIDTSKLSVQGSDARDLQIYYDGTNNVNINVSGSFNGLIYAPSAPVTISGNGTFNGGIVGGAVKVTMTGALNLYTDLAVNSTTAPSVGVGSDWSATDLKNGFTANQNSGVLSPINQGQAGIVGWQPMTWQELN